MKTYYVELIHRNPIPVDGWDIAIRMTKLYIKSESEEEAKKEAEKFLERHGFYMTAVYVHETADDEIF